MLNFTMHLKENPNIRTISMLYSYYHKMLRYHLAPDKSNEELRKTISEICRPLLSPVPLASSNNHTLPQLIRIISILRDYDVKSKGVDANNDEGELLKEMIYKITHV